MSTTIWVMKSKKGQKRQRLIVVRVYDRIMQVLSIKGYVKEKEKFQHDLDQLVLETRGIWALLGQVKTSLTGRHFFAARRDLRQATGRLRRLERKGQTARERLLVACINTDEMHRQIDAFQIVCADLFKVVGRKHEIPAFRRHNLGLRRHPIG